MRTTLRLLKLAALSALLVTAAGCTSVVIKNPKTPFAGYPPAEKINLKVGLNLTDELRKSEWEKHYMIIRPGDYLAENSEILARHVFFEVLKTGSGPADLDAILTPKVVYINRTQGATSFGESITCVKIEWNLSDPVGKPVWIETIAGEARGSTGWTAPEKLLKQALEDLLNKSQQAILSSEAIRQFVSKKTTLSNSALTR